MRLLRRASTVLIVAFVLTYPLFAVERTPAEAEKIAQEVLAHAIIIDTHADTPQMMLDEGYDFADPNSPYMISIPKMRQAHLGAEFMSIWVDTAWPQQDLIHRAIDLMDAVDAQVTLHSDTLEMARTTDDIARIHGNNKIAILMGVEGGHIIEDDLRALDTFYRLGARYMTLTHTKDTNWAGSSGEKTDKGLTDFGRQVVERMNRLGMMVDISHVSDKTFYDAVSVSRAPVIASHSSCRALCNAPRNMTDDMIRALAKNGGVMDINFYEAFLDKTFADAYSAVEKQMDAGVKASQDKARRGRRTWKYSQELAIQQKFAAQLPPVSFERIADHIDHAVKIGGVDHVGLGSDFDGVSGFVPRGMEDCSKLPNLVRELARRGYSSEDLEKILGGNLLRVMGQVEHVAAKMQTEGGK